MANELTIQTILDGPRNAIIKVSGTLDSSDLAQQVLLDPATLGGINNTGLVKAAKLRLQRLTHNIEDGLTVDLWWDATTPVRIEGIEGRGHQNYDRFGGLTNIAGAGVTGKILIATQGWATGSILSFSLLLELVKQQR
jgi:hypothetical protein